MFKAIKPDLFSDNKSKLFSMNNLLFFIFSIISIYDLVSILFVI